MNRKRILEAVININCQQDGFAGAVFSGGKLMNYDYFGSEPFKGWECNMILFVPKDLYSSKLPESDNYFVVDNIEDINGIDSLMFSDGGVDDLEFDDYFYVVITKRMTYTGYDYVEEDRNFIDSIREKLVKLDPLDREDILPVFSKSQFGFINKLFKKDLYLLIPKYYNIPENYLIIEDCKKYNKFFKFFYLPESDQLCKEHIDRWFILVNTGIKIYPESKDFSNILSKVREGF